MARVTYGGIITDIKGSIGGTTFQTSGTGKGVHLKQRPKLRQSSGLELSHSTFCFYVQLWKTLTVTQQAAWSVFAAANSFYDNFNKEKNISGFNWFCSCNLMLSYCSVSPITVPPVYSQPTALTGLSLLVYGSGLYVSASPSVTLSDEYLFIYTTQPVNFTSNKIQATYKKTSVITASPVSRVNITTDFEAAHGFTYADLIEYGKFTIHAFVFRVNIITGIKSLSYFIYDDIAVASRGIGSDIIEKNFIIT